MSDSSDTFAKQVGVWLSNSHDYRGTVERLRKKCNYLSSSSLQRISQQSSVFLFRADSVCCKATAQCTTRESRASRAPKFSLNLCNLVATSNEPTGVSSSPSFAAAGELATFDLAVIDRAMAQPLCIRNEVSGSVSNVAVAVLVSLAETEQGFVHLNAACSTCSRNSLLLPARLPCPNLPAPPSPPKNSLCRVSGSCLAPSQVPFG